MMGVQTVKLRPFHETVVEAILCASGTRMADLAKLIKTTKIPRGHNEIIAAWNVRKKAMCWDSEKLGGVVASLLQQKAEAEAEVAKASADIDLDGLQVEAEKLLALLNDRETGLSSWWTFLEERLWNLHKLTSQVLDK